MRLSFFILAGIVFLSFLARLYNFNAPMVDLHSWRQADTAAIARNFVYDDFDILHPRILSAVSIDGMGRDNTPRYHFAEFPLYQFFVACISLFVGDIVKSGRIVSIFAGLLSVVVLYALARRYYSESIALLGALVFGLLPYSVFWSRTVLPDPLMLLFCLLTLYFFDIWFRGPAVWYAPLFAGIFFSLALLLKIFPIFLLVPMTYLVLRQNKMSWVPAVLMVFVPVMCWNLYLEMVGSRPRKLWLIPFIVILLVWGVRYAYSKRLYLWQLRSLLLFVFLSFIPLLLWRLWMLQWPMSIPASDWLFDGKGVRLKPAWWHWMFQVRLDRYMFNFSGLILISFGLYFHSYLYQPLTNGVRRVFGISDFLHSLIVRFSRLLAGSGHVVSRLPQPDVNWFFPLCFLSGLLYFVILATGNVTHEYYQIVIIPFGAVLAAAGFMYIWNSGMSFGGVFVYKSSAFFVLGLTFLLGWYSVREWYQIRDPMIPVLGRQADLLLPKDALVIAPYGGDTTLLYYINRPGWSVIDKKLQEMIDRGATHFVSGYRDDATNRLARLYKVVDETSEYVILDLRVRTNDPEWQQIPPYGL